MHLYCVDNCTIFCTRALFYNVILYYYLRSVDFNLNYCLFLIFLASWVHYQHVPSDFFSFNLGISLFHLCIQKNILQDARLQVDRLFLQHFDLKSHFLIFTAIPLTGFPLLVESFFSLAAIETLSLFSHIFQLWVWVDLLTHTFLECRLAFFTKLGSFQ
jgi:hypothetical protein